MNAMLRSHIWAWGLIMKILIPLITLAFLVGCSQTTKLSDGSNVLIGKNFATLKMEPTNLRRSIQTTQVATGNLALDIVVNVVGTAARTSGNTAQKTKQILPPSFDPGNRVAKRLEGFMQSQYKVALQPNVQSNVGPAKPAGKWPNEQRVASLASSARAQGFDGVLLDFDTTNLSAESTGSSVNKGGGNVNLNFAGRFALIETKTGKVLSSGNCNTSPKSGVTKLDDILARGPIPDRSDLPQATQVSQVKSVSTSTVTTGAQTVTTGAAISNTPLASNNIGAVTHAQIEPNQTYVDNRFDEMASLCANHIINKALK